ncbi:hypothetical protein NX722_23015 [Endozoicomonas gorgoniicola]|uniref:Uncharacterized protein n=1 Tax=Endozoicomonas gorgoniicola TaxID=1234144 RepID=A0ABT3N1D0_9GAMM|nr:hypothetical protein [Endozoicomonas gorgoniicola]MCW7555442.1 hypothetical protein [Endozoicomonas gorgoniicola]
MTGVTPEWDEFPCYYGRTLEEGISTSVDAYDAAFYSLRYRKPPGYVYLIDAMDMAGFVVSYTMEKFSETPVLEDIREVCFLAPIPNTSVVGAVCPEGLRPLLFSWPEAIVRLNLSVNPEYWSGCENGLAAGKKVVELFNT